MTHLDMCMAQADDAYCGTDYKPSEGIACKPYPDSVLSLEVMKAVFLDNCVLQQSHHCPSHLGHRRVHS
eukprot:6482174-Amphidinium_carterae.1